MEDEKNTDFEPFEEATSQDSGAAQRARNRTVMLTPDITGEVRARLAQDLSAPVHESFDATDDTPVRSAPRGQLLSAPSQPEYDTLSHQADAYTPPSYDAPSVAPQPPQYIPPNAAPQGVRIPAAASEQSNASVMPGNETGDRIVWTKKGKVVGFLTSFDRDENGEFFPLRVGRLIVTSEMAAKGNFLVIADSTVSPMHAILRVSQSGEVQVLDQLSEYGTKIKRLDAVDVEELSGDKGSLEHGDIIYFGERKFHVSILILHEEG